MHSKWKSEGQAICWVDLTLSLTSCGWDRATAQLFPSKLLLWHRGLTSAGLRVKTSSDAEAQRSLLPTLVLRAVYLKATIHTVHNENQRQAGGLPGNKGAEFSLHTVRNKPISQVSHSVKEKTKLKQEFPPGMCVSSGATAPGHGSTSHLLGSVFQYSLDLVHVFFPKVNDGEMNPPVLLYARLPRKQNTCASGPVFPMTGKAQTDTYFVKCTGVRSKLSDLSGGPRWGISGRLLRITCYLYLSYQETMKFKWVNLVKWKPTRPVCPRPRASGPSRVTRQAPTLPSLPLEVQDVKNTHILFSRRASSSPERVRLESLSVTFPWCAKSS